VGRWRRGGGWAAPTPDSLDERRRLPEGALSIFQTKRGDDAFALAIAFADREQIFQVYGQAWTKPKTKTMDLSATVQGIAATLTRYGVKRVYGDRVTGQWIVEAFKRHGVEYVHPTIRRQGNSVYVTRSLAYLEAGPLFRTGAVKILDDPVTCRELRNLELHGDTVDHPSGYHDDRANALCLAAVMAAQRARVSESGYSVASFTKSTLPWHQPERWIDPRGE